MSPTLYFYLDEQYLDLLIRTDILINQLYPGLIKSEKDNRWLISSKASQKPILN